MPMRLINFTAFLQEQSCPCGEYFDATLFAAEELIEYLKKSPLEKIKNGDVAKNGYTGFIPDSWLDHQKYL